jgi:alpha-L-fucosidase
MPLFKIQTMIILTFFLISCRPNEKKEIDHSVYTPDWESLSAHNQSPRWFQDAKFGIYFHWGVYSVPAFDSEWYPRNMHFPGKTMEHHIRHYGPPGEFGYHDFVPLFKAENFNAGKWATLFKKAGARFAGPVAEHHDGFSMWDSDVTPWNAMDKGPHKDMLGELANAFRDQGMKLVTTFHHARNLQRYSDKPDEKEFANSHYPLFEGMPPTFNDPELNMLYGNVPEDRWIEEVWLGKLKEVIKKYHPDIIWFDSWLDLIPEKKQLEFCAYYLNEAAKNDQEVVIVRKQDDLPLTVSINDLEKSRMNHIGDQCWMTDETISKGSWCYTEDLEIKDTRDLLHVLIDIVSKNGVLMLNISPKADGTIPENQKDVLLGIGKWLDQYGEAIYGTRPWYTYGEGPTREPEGHFRHHEEFLKIVYSSEDIRYTTKDNIIYALILGWPEGKDEVVFNAFKDQELSINAVSLLGSGHRISWTIDNGSLQVSLPAEKVNDMAIVYKIEISK